MGEVFIKNSMIGTKVVLQLRYYLRMAGSLMDMFFNKVQRLQKAILNRYK